VARNTIHDLVKKCTKNIVGIIIWLFAIMELDCRIVNN